MSNQQAGSDSTAGKSKTLTFSHLLTIDNFAYLYDENCQWKWNVESEVFSVPENEDLMFSLRIWPKVKGEDGEVYLKVGFCTRQIPAMWEGKVTMKERWCIVDEKGKELWGKEYKESEVFKNRWNTDFEYLPVEKLFDSSAGYMKSGTIRVMCEVTLHCPEAIFTFPGNAHTFSHTSLPSSVSTLSHTFTLSHFKWLCEESTREMPLKVESDYLAPQREDIGRMRLAFYPKGLKGNDEENVLIGIRNQNNDSLLVHYKFSLLDANGDNCHQYDATYRIQPNNSRFHFLPRRHLLSLLDSLPTDELTINCHVTVWGKREQEKALSTTTPTTSTHLDLALFTFHYVPFTWTIERFLAQLTRNLINSKSFFPSTDSRYRFALYLYPNKDKENVTLALYFTSTSSIEESKVNWRFSVVDKEGNEWKVYFRTHCLSKPAKFGPYVLIPHRTLDNFAALLLPEGKLTIKCELWIHEPRKELPPQLRNPSVNDPVASLSSGFPQINISNSQFTNSILASQSTITTGNINANNITKQPVADSAEPSQPK